MSEFRLRDIPGHTLPNYTDDARANALFHYTTANGLIGILKSSSLWGTAYFCANDESELAANESLAPIFRRATHRMVEQNDPRVAIFERRGVDFHDYADNFEKLLKGLTLSSLCTYITCFCKASGQEDFQHGLLSQWRGYGLDGGYAIQFSRSKLDEMVTEVATTHDLGYDLRDVYYDSENALKEEMLKNSSAFENAFSSYLDELAQPLDFSRTSFRSPIADLPSGTIVSFLNYLVHTKNKHFSEEQECRLSLVQLVNKGKSTLPVDYFNRGGLIVPYTQTPRDKIRILDCVEWIIVGPGPRMGARFKSICQLAQQYRPEIKVRPSHIPYTRF